MDRAWNDFRKLLRAVQGQTELLRSIKTNSPMDVPHAWLEQIEELRNAIDSLYLAVKDKAAAIPPGAHPAVLKQRDEVLRKLEEQFEQAYRQLFGGVRHVKHLLDDPMRTSTEFGGELVDHLGNAAQLLTAWLDKRRSKKGKR